MVTTIGMVMVVIVIMVMDMVTIVVMIMLRTSRRSSNRGRNRRGHRRSRRRYAPGDLDVVTRLHEVESLFLLDEHDLQTRESHALLDRLTVLQSRHSERHNWFHYISLRLQRKG